MESPSIFIFDEEMFKLFPECVSVGEGRCNISCQSDAFLKEKIFFFGYFIFTYHFVIFQHHYAPAKHVRLFLSEFFLKNHVNKTFDEFLRNKCAKFARCRYENEIS